MYLSSWLVVVLHAAGPWLDSAALQTKRSDWSTGAADAAWAVRHFRTPRRQLHAERVAGISSGRLGLYFLLYRGCIRVAF
jgi:hypothetical protein